MQHEAHLNFVQAVIGEAIRERRLISGTYNSSRLTLAPHQIILRNEAFYLGAVNPNKARRHDEEPTLGYFKIDGLTDVKITPDTFEALASEALIPTRDGDRVIVTLD